MEWNAPLLYQDGVVHPKNRSSEIQVSTLFSSLGIVLLEASSQPFESGATVHPGVYS